MRPKKDPPQLAFSWFYDRVPDATPKRKKSLFQKLRWPPQIGRKIAFRTDCGVETGVLRAIRQGLVWRDYVMKDGRIAAESEIVMRPCGPIEWRDPMLVPEFEVLLSVQRIKAAHEANRGQDPRKVASLCAVPVIEPLAEILCDLRERDGNPSTGPILRRPSGKPMIVDNL
jgi:hypothetical protein